MILTLTTTHRPATDLGYLLNKNPDRLHSLEFAFGLAHVAYSEATEERCTAALIVEVDPVHLVRGGPSSGDSGVLAQYVNDRPYCANSLMSSALAKQFRSAMSGRSKERPELVEASLPFEVRIPVLPARGGEDFVRDVFEPLGYEVEVRRLPLDEQYPDWGNSSYLDVTLRATMRLADLLTHLYVLIPVLDNSKHYWVAEDEVEKLLKKGEKWLSGHPKKEIIARRYLRNQRSLAQMALARMTEEEGDPNPDERQEANAQAEEEVERKIALHDLRLTAVRDALLASGARRIVDIGCGEGKLLRLLLKEKQFDEIVGMDVAFSVLERAKERLKLDRMAPRVAKRLKLLHGSMVYRDKRLERYDAAAVVEVIEHLDPPRLASFERVLFQYARPGTVVVTTPNREYNALFPDLPAGKLRHRDHRFEWTRAEFTAWAERIGETFGYSVQIRPIGPIDEIHGAPSQMAVFGRSDS